MPSTAPADPVPYGAWPSPLTAADVARGMIRLAAPRLVGTEVWWSEGRPAEGGRSVVVRRDAAGARFFVTTDPLTLRGADGLRLRRRHDPSAGTRAIRPSGPSRATSGR